MRRSDQAYRKGEYLCHSRRKVWVVLRVKALPFKVFNELNLVSISRVESPPNAARQESLVTQGREDERVWGNANPGRVVVALNPTSNQAEEEMAT
jgi:hypothetical protein